MKSVLEYKMRDDVFIVYKDGSILAEKDLVSKKYRNFKEYEDEKGYLLEELFPSALILMAKERLKWKLYQYDSKFYERLPNNTTFFLDVNRRVLSELPQGSQQVGWCKHPYRVLL